MSNVKRKKEGFRSLFRGEKAIYMAIIFIILAIPVASVYTKAILSESSIAREQVENRIKEQESINDGLKMEISELASLDKIQVIAAENGLTYKNNNIKVVTSE